MSNVHALSAASVLGGALLPGKLAIRVKQLLSCFGSFIGLYLPSLRQLTASMLSWDYIVH